MAAPGKREKMAACRDDAAERMQMKVSSTNPFLMDITETFRVQRDSVNQPDGGHTGNGYNTNPFVTSMELTSAAHTAADCTMPLQPNGSWPLTPPPSRPSNPFITPPAQQIATCGESVNLSQLNCGPAGCAAFTPAPLQLNTAGNHSTTAAVSDIGDQLINPLTPMNCNHCDNSTPAALPQASLSPLPVSPFTPCKTQYAGLSHGVQALGSSHILPGDAQLSGGGQPKLCGCGQLNLRHAESAPHSYPVHPMRCDGRATISDDGLYEQERIPTLRPGQFDGSGAWKDFLYQFESCAQANHWSEKTKAVQLRFNLTGAAGAIIHKNPRSGRWSYQQIVDEIEAAYGPCSEHAAAIGIELRQRVRQPGETLHSLRDDIYEKVSIVYADRTEREQEAISVETFTNALADAETVQKLLEEQPRTLAGAYDIAHRYETTRRAAKVVTQLMRAGVHSSTERRARAAVVRDNANTLQREELERTAMSRAAPPERVQKSPRQWRPQRNNGQGKKDWRELVCHKCSGIGHIQRNCPSPHWPRQPVVTAKPTPTPDLGTVVIGAKGQEEEMCVQVTMYGLEICALLDSGARRSVLPLHYFNAFPIEARPPIRPSVARTLQGVGPESLSVLGEVDVPAQIGGRIVTVNFIIADTFGSTEVILGHPFLLQAQACLDYGRREITLFGEKVPRCSVNPEPEVHFVRVARRTVLGPGCEYVVPGTVRLRPATVGDLVLSPVKCFVERHRVLVARVVVQAQQSADIPIRVFNPGASSVTLKKGAVAGVLQPAKVVEVVAPQPLKVLTAPETANLSSAPVPPHLQALYSESCMSLPDADRGRLASLLQSYSDVFSTGPTDLGRTGLVQHDILTTPGPPVKQQPRRMARDKQIAADQQVQGSLEAGVARPSNSSWAAPIVMVRKKDQSPRLCVDYRPLNERTIKDAYPLPRIQDTLDTLSTAKYFSTLDLTSGYWQVEMTPRARKAAAFCTRKRLFEWNVMPFGLCNAPATFQRLMDRVLVGLQWETCLVYLDDIIVLGRDITQMLERLVQVFTRLRGANLKLKPSKCCLFREQVSYLGHVVSARGIATDPEKVLKVVEWPAPQNISEVCQFVGLASYYRRFVEDFATVAKPLHELTKKYARFNWTAECQEAFEELKVRLTSAPVLAYPLDSGEFFLDTDASDWGIGAVLSQMQGGEERVLSYGSRRLSPTEQNYCTTRRELLAVVEFTSHFRQYLLGRSFTVRTDHSSLRWLTKLREPEGQLARWLEKLAEYDFQVLHRPGKFHQNADALSRRPCRSSCPCTVSEPDSSSNDRQHKGVQCNLTDCLAEGGPLTTSPEQNLVGVVDALSDNCYDHSLSHPSISRVTESPQLDLFKGWTREQLKAAQTADPDIAPVCGWLEEGGSEPTWTDVAPHSPATKAYWAQRKRLYQRDGVVLRKFYCGEGKVFYPQILLPHPYRTSVMAQMHEGPVGGHFGAEKTLSRLKTRYFWYDMKNDVTLWCRTCISCAAKARPKKTPRAAMGTVKVGGPMERIAVDLMGPLNETERHNRYIVVVQDYFSKWVEAYPVPDEQAITVAEKITSEWVCRHGAPHSLHSDQGTNFESAVFQGMCTLLGIEKTRTTPFHPQSDGQVERFNATLQKILATTAERCHWDWDIMIPYALMAYRATKHSSTGLSPNMMLYGRETTEPVDLVAGTSPDNVPVSSPPHYVMQLRERLELSHQLAREALGRSAERAKRQYDKNIHQVHYQVGDAVWHLIKGTKRVKDKVRKFLPSYEGPYFIVGQLDDLVYRIQKGQRTKAKVVHHDKLKPYHSRTPLDNSWVPQSAEEWAPVEVPSPTHDSSNDADIGPLNLWDTETEATAGEALHSTRPVPPSHGQSPEDLTLPQRDEARAQDPGGARVQCLPPASSPCQRPRRVCKVPDRLGNWISH
uniref:Gypsy retrotransposon integrase-like protein 1 n=2 Tax=Seriola lalandi dorsalis TaxID=1841481 RepID=A0A3B4WDD1_SERLL